MGWVMTRAVTDEDVEKLNKAARRFFDRHPEIKRFMMSDPRQEQGASWFGAVDNSIRAGVNSTGDAEYKNLHRLWLRCIRRATGEEKAEGIAYGCIGHQAE